MINRRIEVLPEPEGPKRTPISVPRRRATSTVRPAWIRRIRRTSRIETGCAQCPDPRTGRVRCTSQSALIETKEIQSVNHPARAGSPAWTAS